MIDINLLPVGKGDCLHIRWADTKAVHHLVIDSGPSTAKRTFRGLLRHIYESGEKVDLLCFSHIDDDHIRAASLIIPEESFIGDGFIGEAWLNVGAIHSQEEMKSAAHTRDLSVQHADALYQALKAKNIPVRSDIIAGQQYRVGDAAIDILSPDTVQHEKFSQYWKKEAEKHLLTAHQDTSITNGDSIALALTVNGKHFLFLGDAYASVVTKELLFRQPAEEAVLAKLSHHGSSYNLSSDLLQVMNTTCYLVSSAADAGHFSRESRDILASYQPEQGKWVYCNFNCRLEERQNLHIETLDVKGVQLEEGIRIYSQKYEG